MKMKNKLAWMFFIIFAIVSKTSQTNYNLNDFNYNEQDKIQTDDGASFPPFTRVKATHKSTEFPLEALIIEKPVKITQISGIRIGDKAFDKLGLNQKAVNGFVRRIVSEKDSKERIIHIQPRLGLDFDEIGVNNKMSVKEIFEFVHGVAWIFNKILENDLVLSRVAPDMFARGCFSNEEIKSNDLFQKTKKNKVYLSHLLAVFEKDSDEWKQGRQCRNPSYAPTGYFSNEKVLPIHNYESLALIIFRFVGWNIAKDTYSPPTARLRDIYAEKKGNSDANFEVLFDGRPNFPGKSDFQKAMTKYLNLVFRVKQETKPKVQSNASWLINQAILKHEEEKPNIWANPGVEAVIDCFPLKDVSDEPILPPPGYDGLPNYGEIEQSPVPIYQ